MAIQSNIITDLSTVSKIPIKVLQEISKKACLCIGSAIHDAVISKEEAVVLSIGIGTLSVEVNTKLCKFTPSKELRAAIKQSIDEKVDPVEFQLEQEIIDKLLAIKDEVL